MSWTVMKLFRLRLAAFNAISAMGGYFLFPGEREIITGCGILLGVMFLAAGGSALNQVIERDIDGMMSRTRLRPIPAGRLTPVTAMILGCLSIMAGLTAIGAAGGFLPAILGGGVLVWYLCVYTPLKRRTPLALAIGSLCGAVAPVIGWAAAGGVMADFRIVFLSGLLFLWQVPHFWLLQSRYADDYRTAGIPVFCSVANGKEFGHCCRLWIFALFAATMLLPAFGIVERQFAILFVLFPLPLLIGFKSRTESALFSYLNIFPVITSLLLFLRR